jgi:hypothetical protein
MCKKGKWYGCVEFGFVDTNDVIGASIQDKIDVMEIGKKRIDV